MKFKIDRDAFVAALQASIAVPSLAVPTLAYSRLSVEDGTLTIASTDMHSVVWTDVKCMVVTEGEPFLVDAKILSRYVSTLPVGVVTVITTPEFVQISAGKSKSALAIVNQSKYVNLPRRDLFSELTWYDVPRPRFFADFEVVRPVVSAQTEMPHFCQAAVRNNKWVAYDGKRVHTKDADGYEIPDLVIPYYGIKHLKTVFGRSDFDIMRLALADLAVIYQVGNTTLLVYNLKAKFASVKQFLTKGDESGHMVSLDREELFLALNRVGHTVSGAGWVQLNISPESIKISSKSLMGDSEAELACKADGDYEVRVNARHLYDAFKALPSATGYILLEDGPQRPIRIFPPPAAEKFSAVISQVMKDVL